jgi:pimeloyl-ACP methyl ester carboxylesterase
MQQERILGNLCVYTRNSIGANSPIFVFHHGAGFTSQTWFLLVSELQNIIDCTVVTYDCRGHGKSVSDAGLSLDALVSDLVTVVREYQRDSPVVLVGHSMGGAVVCHASLQLKNIVGTVVIDVVEGTAIESLASMNAILMRRPTSFKSLDDAIHWALENQTRNRKAAEISMPSQIKLVNDKYYWITNLRDTSSFWSGWFTGLSEQFLKMKCARLLILAGLVAY